MLDGKVQRLSSQVAAVCQVKRLSLKGTHAERKATAIVFPSPDNLELVPRVGRLQDLYHLFYESDELFVRDLEQVLAR